jgi:hypothetical protein
MAKQRGQAYLKGDYSNDDPDGIRIFSDKIPDLGMVLQYPARSETVGFYFGGVYKVGSLHALGCD